MQVDVKGPTSAAYAYPLLDRKLEALENWLTANMDLIKARFRAASTYTPALLNLIARTRSCAAWP
jgi:hypothetical protein